MLGKNRLKNGLKQNTLEGLEGEKYGAVITIMKRKINHSVD